MSLDFYADKSSVKMENVCGLFNRSLQIAVFQRDFRWNESYVINFVRDIYRHYKYKGKGRHMFASHMILHNWEGDAGGGTFFVVDGQQRLVTLWLLISALDMWCCRHARNPDDSGENPPLHNSWPDCPATSLRFKRGGDAAFRLSEDDLNRWFHDTFSWDRRSRNAAIHKLLDELDPQNYSTQQQTFMDTFRAIMCFLSNAFNNQRRQDLETLLVHCKDLPRIHKWYLDHHTKVVTRHDNLEDLQKFAHFVYYHVHMSVTWARSKEAAMDVYMSINNHRDHSAPAHDTDLLKALLVRGSAEEQQQSAKMWGEAAEKFHNLVGCSRSEPQGHEFFRLFFVTLIEMSPRPRDTTAAATEALLAEPPAEAPSRVQDRVELATKITRNGNVSEDWRCLGNTITDYFRFYYVLEHVEQAMSVELVQGRSKLCPFEQQENEWHTVETVADQERQAVGLLQKFLHRFVDVKGRLSCPDLFINFFKLDDSPWKDGVYLGGTASYRLQNRITLLKHAAHMGLHMDWTTVAFAFSLKFCLVTSRAHAAAAEKFFELLELLVTFDIFCSEKRPPPTETGERRSSLRRSFGWYMAEYRQLMSRIYHSHSANDVLDYMQEAVENFSLLLKDKILGTFKLTDPCRGRAELSAYRKKCAWMLLKAEWSCAQEQPTAREAAQEQAAMGLEKILSEKFLEGSKMLPRGSENGDFAPSMSTVDRNYHTIDIEHIHSKSNTDSWNEQEHDMHLECLGNMALTSKWENNMVANLSFQEKRNHYPEFTFSLTREVGRCREWTPLTVEERRRRVLKAALTGWSFNASDADFETPTVEPEPAAPPAAAPPATRRAAVLLAPAQPGSQPGAQPQTGGQGSGLAPPPGNLLESEEPQRVPRAATAGADSEEDAPPPGSLFDLCPYEFDSTFRHRERRCPNRGVCRFAHSWAQWECNCRAHSTSHLKWWCRDFKRDLEASVPKSRRPVHPVDSFLECNPRMDTPSRKFLDDQPWIVQKIVIGMSYKYARNPSAVLTDRINRVNDELGRNRRRPPANGPPRKRARQQ